MSTGTRALGWLSAFAGLLLGTTVQAQEAVPAYPTEAEVVTVDVVVLDKDGRPARGLAEGDFTVEDDGEPQEIVAFEVRDLAAPDRSAPAAGEPSGAQESKETPGRTIGLIVDDLGLDVRSVAAVQGVKKWLTENADPRDEVTLLTSSGKVEWWGRVGTGREELARAVGRIRPKRGSTWFTTDSRGRDGVITEWQAYQTVSGVQGCMGEKCILAQEIVSAWRDRARALVRTIERFARDHAEERGRKAAIVFTQGFIRDDDLKQTEEAIEAARRSNLSLYFIDPRGVVAGGLVFAEDPFEAMHNIDLGGALHMAEETGGTLARHNDLRGALTQMVDESSAYYLVGFASPHPPDGEWHTLRVEVAGRGLAVRARRGYYARVPSVPPR